MTIHTRSQEVIHPAVRSQSPDDSLLQELVRRHEVSWTLGVGQVGAKAGKTARTGVRLRMWGSRNRTDQPTKSWSERVNAYRDLWLIARDSIPKEPSLTWLSRFNSDLTSLQSDCHEEVEITIEIFHRPDTGVQQLDWASRCQKRVTRRLTELGACKRKPA